MFVSSIVRMFPIRSRTEVVAAVALILVAGIITSDGAPPAGFAAHRNGKPRVRNKIILPLLLRSGSLAQISDLAVALLPGMCQEVKGGNLGGGLSCANPLRWCSTLASRSLLPVADPRPGLPGQQPPGSWILHPPVCFILDPPLPAAVLHRRPSPCSHAPSSFSRPASSSGCSSSSPATTGLHRAYFLHSGVKLHPDPTSSEMSTMEGSWALLNLRYKRGPSIPAYRTPIYGDLPHGGNGDVSSDLC